MKALVTGASGFIGSTLIQQLGTLGFEVFALMRKSSSAKNLEGLKYQRIEGDLSDLESLKRAVPGMNHIFHLAGITAAPDRATFFEHNAHGAARLAQAIAEANPGLTRLVHVSSLAAAGPASSMEPRREDDAENPVSYYGQSKLQGEKEVLAYRDRFPVSVIRPPIVYGPKDKGVFVLIQTVAKNFMPVLQGSTADGHKYYSAIHVEDLCRGITQAALAPAEKNPSGSIYYLADDGLYTYRDIMTTIAECLDRDPISVKVPKAALKAAGLVFSAAGVFTKKTFPLNLDKLNEILPDYWICSNQKARERLAFTPEFDLRTGMAQAIEWYKRERWI